MMCGQLIGLVVLIAVIVVITLIVLDGSGE